MCGIAGMVVRGAPASTAGLSAMAARLHHRGPEDRGQAVFEGFGLAHTRLSIIDLAGGHQPLEEDTGRYGLVANGEFYNHLELLAELRALGAVTRTASDAEAALHGWAYWGQDVLARLHGMYAFALLDRAQRRLWLVRDRLGIKPLYYAALPDRVLFASEIKALLAALPQTPALSPQALSQYFQNQASSGRETVFQGIHRVLPGEALCIGPDLSIVHHRYWSPDSIRPQRLTHEQALEAWEPLFEQVLREHLRADVPLGLFLSGGVDSAVLLARLSRLQPHPVRTFSIGWSDAALGDELEAAQAVATRFGAQHETIRLSAADVFQRLPRMVWAADDLMRDYACLPTLALAEAAGRELKVVFSGEGGDEAFAGYGRYRPGGFERWYKRLRYPGSGGFRARGELRGAHLRGLFVPDLEAALAVHRAPFVAAWQDAPPDWSDLQRRQAVDIATNLPDDLLVKADRMLMAAGVEGRVPFCDHRVIAFGLSLPDALKVRRDAGKVFLKRWAEGFLPTEHLWRRKTGFHVPVNAWLRGPFLEALAERLPRSAAIAQWCRPQAVQALLRRQQARHDATRELWSLMQFALWHRLFVEGGAEPGFAEDPLAWL